ncbi:MAG: hypothetical protein ACRD3O_06760 [Terriglobia bacterium]
MHWVLAGITLIAVGVTCRRVLCFDEPQGEKGIPVLRWEREHIYQSVAVEVDTQIVILGISLNEALGECSAGNYETAWRLVHLAICQWARLADAISLLLTALDRNLPSTRTVPAIRSMRRDRFKSPAMVEFVQMRDLLDQLVFRSKVRFKGHLGVLERAVEALSADLERACGSAECQPDGHANIWSCLDPAFYDFDLIIKETLLSFRAFLLALPDSALGDFAQDLIVVANHSVRVKSSLAVH